VAGAALAALTFSFIQQIIWLYRHPPPARTSKC